MCGGGHERSGGELPVGLSKQVNVNEKRSALRPVAVLKSGAQAEREREDREREEAAAHSSSLPSLGFKSPFPKQEGGF